MSNRSQHLVELKDKVALLEAERLRLVEALNNKQDRIIRMDQHIQLRKEKEKELRDEAYKSQVKLLEQSISYYNTLLIYNSGAFALLLLMLISGLFGAQYLSSAFSVSVTALALFYIYLERKHGVDQ